MKTNATLIKKIVIVAISLLVFTAFVYTMFGVQKRPVLQVATYRKCDFISIDGSTKVICADASQWMALELTTVESPPITPLADDTSSPAFGVAPVVAAPVVAAPVVGTPVQVRYSHYWPPLGGTNCSKFVNGICISNMASGKPWPLYVGTAVACPPEWGFGTTVELDGHVWTCLDRGSAIKYVDGIPWVDFLEATGVYAHGTIITARVSAP